MLKIKNYEDHGEIYLYGDIITDTEASWLKRDDDGTLGYVFPQKVKDELDELNGKTVTVHIASDGGDVSAAVAIYNMLVNHNAPTKAIIDSWAASAASLIAFGCNTIEMPENTFLMIHNPKAGVFGDGEYLRSVAEWLDKLQDMIAETYVKASNKTIDEIKELMDAETWFTAKEALETFSDKINVVDANSVEAVAKLMNDAGIDVLTKSKYATDEIKLNVLEATDTNDSVVNNAKNEVDAENSNIETGSANNADETKNYSIDDIKNIINTLTEAFTHEA